MDSPEDRFTVFLRDTADAALSAESVEQPVATLPSYEDARRVCAWYQQEGHRCVIRFAGATGGGD